MTLPALLTELESLGVHLTVYGNRLDVDAPMGVLTQDLREALFAQKEQLLSQVGTFPPSDSALAHFERRGPCVEVRVPWLPETIWLVPAQAVERIRTERGVHRGRIWTPKELKVLHQIPELTSDSAQDIARAKAHLEAELGVLLSAQQKKVQVQAERSEHLQNCPACRGKRFWRSGSGKLTCGVCHPPAVPSLVTGWIENGVDQDGAGTDSGGQDSV